MRFISGHPALRMIAGAATTMNFFGATRTAVFAVFLVRQVGLSAGPIGALTSCAAAGGLAGAFSAAFLARCVGSARVIWLASLTSAPFALLIPLTFAGPGLVCYAVGVFVVNFGAVVYNVNEVSYRQLVCPTRLLGRMNATMRFLAWGNPAPRRVLGGALGTWLGNRDALWVAGAGAAMSPIWLLASRSAEPGT